MKKLFFALLTSITSFCFAESRDSTHRGFEFGPSLLTYKHSPFFFNYSIFKEPRFTFLNGFQVNYNFKRISLRTIYNASNEHIESDVSDCNDCGGGYYFEKKKQLKLGVQYSFLTKVRQLYAFGDFTGTVDKKFGKMFDGQGMEGGNYTFENKMKGYGWDIGFGYKVKVRGNLYLAAEISHNTVKGRTIGEQWNYLSLWKHREYNQLYIVHWLAGRVVLFMKVK